MATPTWTKTSTTDQAQCVTDLTTFQQFMNTCADDTDKRSRRIFRETDFLPVLDTQKTIAEQQLATLRNYTEFRKNSSTQASDFSAKVQSLEEQIIEMKQKLSDIQNESEVSTVEFLDQKNDAPTGTRSFGNLQDIALFVFFLSLIILAFTIVSLQLFKIGEDGYFGAIKRALLTLVGFAIFILVTYAVIKEIA